MSARLSFRDRVAAFFRAHPHEWLDGDLFRTIGGKYAYRTRISDCRTELGMTIENRLRKVGAITISEYCYQPPLDPDCPTCCGHDLNAWSLH